MHIYPVSELDKGQRNLHPFSKRFIKNESDTRPLTDVYFQFIYIFYFFSLTEIALIFFNPRRHLPGKLIDTSKSAGVAL